MDFLLNLLFGGPASYSVPASGNIFEFIGLISVLIDRFIVPLLFAVAFIVFLYGVYNYFIASAENDEKRKEARKFVLYGLAGFVIMIAVWGLVNLITNSLGLDTKARPTIPTSGALDRAGGGGGGGGGQQMGGGVGAPCNGPFQCQGNTICVMNGNTGQGTCRAI